MQVLLDDAKSAAASLKEQLEETMLEKSLGHYNSETNLNSSFKDDLSALKSDGQSTEQTPQTHG